MDYSTTISTKAGAHVISPSYPRILPVQPKSLCNNPVYSYYNILGTIGWYRQLGVQVIVLLVSVASSSTTFKPEQ